MKRRAAAALLLVSGLAQVCLVRDADAQRRGGGMRGGGARMSRPMTRPSQPVQRPSNPGGGYDFKNDVGRPPSASQLPSGPGNRVPGNGIGNGPGIGNRPPVAPINPPGPAWGWNGGVVWYPAYGYWGGGFWGPYGYGYWPIVYGEYVHEESSESIKSYEIAPDSPGAKVLQNYGLTQTQCGPTGLVVILGPESSVICAQANQSVTPGEYELDATNLTLVSKNG
jgi:hypothetical protein